MGFLEERDLSNVPTIVEYYKGKTIFITGGSGFMGKVLIEKLLYSCTDLDRIYLLLRPRKGVKPEDRLAALYSEPCYERLRNEKPGVFESKVFVVAGDVMDVGLGISDEDRALLINKVNVIFHVAASVRFDDSLKFAATMNIRGTKEIVNLSKEIRNLSALVHVSTAYSNTNRKIIEEIMYPAHADWRDTLQICDVLDEHLLRVVTPKYLGEIPNTYTFTKQLGEHLVYEEKGKLPVVIIRPSIVVSSAEEPVKGWIDNFNGPFGLLAASGKGIMRSVHSDPDLISDYIPVDMSIRHIIAAGWIRGTKMVEESDDIPIYNCCAGDLKQLTTLEMVEFGKAVAAAMPMTDVLWSVGGSITPYKSVHYIKVLLFHLLPALFVDGALRIMGKKPMLVKIQRRIYIANLALGFYLTQQWTFDNKNFVHLRSCIKEEDKKDFYYDLENIEKHEIYKAGYLGLQKYVFKQKEEDAPRARAHYKRMVILNFIVKSLFYGYLFWWLVNTNYVKSLGQNLLHLEFYA